MRRVPLTVSSIALAFATLSVALHAARTPTTYNIADGDVSGLVAAIVSANTSAGADTINLAPGGTYTLTVGYDTDNGLPPIVDTLTVNGYGATIARSVAPGTPNFRIVQVNATATFSGVTIQNGRHDNFGGGILNFGTLTLQQATVSDNAAALYGGGVFSWPGSSLTVLSSTFTRNIADTFNPAGCHSCSYGGGINSWGTLIVVNSTIAQNETGFSGAGLYSNGSVYLSNSTVAYNHSLNNAGGVAIDSGGSLAVVNTLLASNTGTSFNPTNCSAIGPVTSSGHNLSTDGTCVAYFGQPGDMNNTPAGLDPGGVQDNGGPTETIALIVGSAAMDAGGDAACASSPVNGLDQRGVVRPVGAHCDIGAFEAPAPVVDTAGPVVTCDPPDSFWHATDISLHCSASDDGSGLLNAGDASFFLSTSVPAGVETANASTGPYTVCDTAGNCTTAGPIGGNKIDKRAPTITITAPSAVAYLLNQNVAAAFGCADGGSAMGSCVGTVASGASVSTGTAGTHTFSVTATDAVGNTTTQQISYTVRYGQCLLYDSTKAHKAGSTIPIKLQLCDAAGVNVSNTSVTLTATAVYLVSTNAPGPLADSGNANPDYQFRFAGDQYIFNLSLKGFAVGTYALVFTAGTDPTPHVLQFQVK